MSRSITHQIKNGKYRSFLLFLLLSLVFWVLTKFSKEYSETIQATLVYKNIPEQVTIVGERSSMIRFDIVTNGFESLFFKIKKPKIDLNINSYYKDGMKSISLSNNDLVNIINDQLSNYNSVKSVFGDGLIIELDSIVSIKLPVIIRSNIQFKEGFKGMGDFVKDPDSVLVFGPQNKLNTIEHIVSESLELNEVDNDIDKSIKLLPPEDVNISIETKNVRVLLKVEEFTQKQLILPIELINIPEGQTVKLLPETVTITFDVSIEEFNTITESDFRIICDFSERDETNNSLNPILENFPESLSNLVLGTQRIEYLIFK